MSGKPMDPERLAKLRRWPQAASTTEVLELLDDRDLLGDQYGDIVLLADAKVAEAKRWRSQCPVTAEHVEAAGVTEGMAMRWCEANEYRPRGGGTMELFWSHRGQSSAMSPWMHPRRMQYRPDAGEVAGFINAAVAHGDGRPAFDILDEMATATPGGDQ